LKTPFWAVLPVSAQTPQSAAADRQALAVLHRMQAALGGADQLAAIRALDWTVSAQTWDASGSPGPDGIRRIRWMRPNLFRKDQHAGSVTVLEFFDGNGGWEVVPDGGLLELKGNELAIVRREAAGFWPNIVLADRSSRFQIRSGGGDSIRITSADDSDVVVEISVDPGTGLPIRGYSAPLSGSVTTTYQRVRQRMEYREWQSAGAIRWPHKTINYHDDVKRAEITTTEIQLNPSMRPEDLSSQPRA
jgi:hypothetical protein